MQTLAAAIEGMDEGMWITDANGVVLRHNEALRRMLGIEQELVGQRPLFLVRRTDLHDAVLRACREGVTSKVEVSMDAPRSKTLEVHVEPARAARCPAAPPCSATSPSASGWSGCARTSWPT